MATPMEVTDSQLSCSTTFSTSTMNDTTRQSSLTAVDVRFCLIGAELRHHKQLHDALQKMKMPYVFSDTGQEYTVQDDQAETVFVMSEFDGETFDTLTTQNRHILGTTAILQSAATDEHLPCVTRPLFCRHMDKLVICFTGFLDKAELKRLVVLVHNMAGSIRKDYGPRVTHLVANSSNSEKYRVAVSLGTPIMTKEWIQATWDYRQNKDCSATSEEMLKYKMPPFFGCTLGFLGFTQDDQRHMEEITQTQGGRIEPIANDSCTHIVVDENTVAEQVLDYPHKIKVVKQEWFWASIQMDARAEENLYAFRTPSTPASLHGTPNLMFSGSKSSRKRRLKDSIAALSCDTDHLESPMPAQKRRSSFAESASCMSISASSILDYSQTPNSSAALAAEPCTPMETETPKKPVAPTQPLSKRHMTAMELLQTEINYVKILDTIITVFKEPLETEQTGGPILAQEEIKTIFNRIPDIYAVHCRLKNDIQALIDDYSDDKSIGQMFLKHSADMGKAYPSFVNFFEQAKQTVVQCDKQKPRFHAFLKIGQSKPECGRQSLTELLIRPVQRLPSMILLLSDLSKRTPDSHPDHRYLKDGLEALKKVTEQINEDKRKTEGHTQMFDIMNEIEGVPAHLLSAHRHFITKIDVSEIGKADSFGEKGICITMFLFSDTLEICKKRVKHSNMKTSQKTFKHIELLNLSYIRRVLDINQTDECHNAFALLCKPPMDVLERTDRLYMFAVSGDESCKTEWLRILCQHMANATCKTDADNFLCKISPEDLELSKSDFDVTRRNKAVRAAKRATKKVSRTFSFNRTPRRSMQKAVSNVTSTFSPMVTGEGVSPQQFGKMGARLAGTMTMRALSPLARRTPLTPRHLQKSLTMGPSATKKL